MLGDVWSRFGNPLWKAANRGAEVVYHSAALLTGSRPALSPHSSNRCLTEKTFSQLEREGRENICFTIHHTGGGENRGEKTSTCMIFYCT